MPIYFFRRTNQSQGAIRAILPGVHGWAKYKQGDQVHLVAIYAKEQGETLGISPVSACIGTPVTRSHHLFQHRASHGRCKLRHPTHLYCNRQHNSQEFARRHGYFMTPRTPGHPTLSYTSCFAFVLAPLLLLPLPPISLLSPLFLCC